MCVRVWVSAARYGQRGGSGSAAFAGNTEQPWAVYIGHDEGLDACTWACLLLPVLFWIFSGQVFVAVRVFSSTVKIFKKCYSNYHIECLRLVHGVLNVDEKKLIAQFGRKLRDERFEPN